MINPTSSPDYSHFPVMLDEVIKICSPKKGGVYLDCTFGGGSYSKELLNFSDTKVIALDRDRFIRKISKHNTFMSITPAETTVMPIVSLVTCDSHHHSDHYELLQK